MAFKMGPTSQLFKIFHPKSTEIDEKPYNDPLWIGGIL
jgi:hypothetical protein